MLRPLNKVLLSLCSAIILGSSALAQSPTRNEVAAGPAPPAESGDPSQQRTDAASPHLGQGTQAQAEHSAEATAHKTINDPNNQLGTSLQGRTRPVAGSGGRSQNDTPSSPEAVKQ